MSSEVVTIPSPPQKKKNDKQEFKREAKDYLVKKMFISKQKKYDLINLEIDFLVKIDKINKKIGQKMISNSFVIRNIKNVDLQQIEYLLPEINLYINLYLNSYNETLNLNKINDLIKIINNLFEKSK